MSCILYVVPHIGVMFFVQYKNPCNIMSCNFMPYVLTPLVLRFNYIFSLSISTLLSLPFKISPSKRALNLRHPILRTSMMTMKMKLPLPSWHPPPPTLPSHFVLPLVLPSSSHPFFPPTTPDFPLVCSLQQKCEDLEGFHMQID